MDSQIKFAEEASEKAQLRSDMSLNLGVNGEWFNPLTRLKSTKVGLNV